MISWPGLSAASPVLLSPGEAEPLETAGDGHLPEEIETLGGCFKHGACPRCLLSPRTLSYAKPAREYSGPRRLSSLSLSSPTLLFCAEY